MLCLRFFYYAAFYLYYYRTQIPIIIGHKCRPQDTKLTSVYLYENNMHFSIRMAGARRGGVAALTARWAVNSQSGEQFIIATGNCSRRYFIRTAGDVCPYSENNWFAHTYPQYALSVTINRAASPGVRGFKWISSFFRRRKKEAKKSLATTTAAVSQTPQRFLVREKINAYFPIVWTGVPDCSIMVLSKSRKINLDTIKP